MTRKAERATSIRRLTAPEKELLSECGDIVDESLPASAQRFIGKLREVSDKEGFAASFGEILGRFRDETGELELPVARQLELLDEARALLDELSTRLEYLPPLVTSYGMLARWKSHGESLDACRDRLNAELSSMTATLGDTRTEIQKFAGHSGEKPADARDRLFRSTMTLLPTNLTNTARARIVGELLALCGVPVPRGEKELLRLAAKVGKIAP